MCFPSLPPQQQIEIKLRTPRSGDVNYAWNHEQSDANLMLNAKQHKNISLGAASFVGEIAQIVANFLQNNSSFKFGEVSFSRNGTDIMASLGIYSSYESIIERMNSNGTATNKTAKQILKNLSKGCIMPDENGNIPLDELENKIFEGLNDSAKKLMAVLICETIRFNDDGACARMAMRNVIARFNGSNHPFEDVFVKSEGTTPLSIFATNGGKQRMIDQIIGYESACKNISIFEQDKAILEKNINFISDDEDENESSSNFWLNTWQPSTHSMKTRNKGEYSQGFYEDPLSSTVPSSARRQISTVRTFGNHDAIHFNLDEPTEEQETDTVGPLGEHFCKNCNLLYWQGFGQSDATVLNECPNCHSADSVEFILDKDIARLVLENHEKGRGKVYFKLDADTIIDGIFVEE